MEIKKDSFVDGFSNMSKTYHRKIKKYKEKKENKNNKHGNRRKSKI
jgi:hypothetical protein